MIRAIIPICLFLGLTSGLHAQTGRIDSAAATASSVMDDFMALRFGMFIHWGPVSLRGTEIGWSRGHQVATDDYDNLYKEFNPVLFDADDWVRAARDAGMKYLTITSKHHDGFCLWPSACTGYDIMSSPFKRDILGELSKACRKYGIKFCVYFSILDWHDPNYPVHNDGKGLYPNGNMDAFRSTIKCELKEIVTKYDPYMLWFDGQWESPWTDEMGIDLYAYLKSLKKDLIINNRLGKEMAGVENRQIDVARMVGDFDTPEQKIGNFSLDLPWESCITIGGQWAWKPNDTMKSFAECLHTLVRTASGNGNLLLNVGPMPDGRIEQRQVDVLKQMGGWLKTYGESIYETNGGPYLPGESYTATRRDKAIFIHVFDTASGEIALPVLPGTAIISAFWMNGGPADWKEAGERLLVSIPEHLPDEVSNVLVLEVDRPVMDIPIVKPLSK